MTEEEANNVDIEAVTKAFFANLENRPKESREEYLASLPLYKKMLSKFPAKALPFHFKNAIEDERYELAALIEEKAKAMGVDLHP